MNIVSFVDKNGSAIDRLEQMTKMRLWHIDYNVLSFHPKRPDPAEIEDARIAIQRSDLIHFAYWKSAIKILEMFPEVRAKKKILTHHNEHNIIGDWEWKKEKWDAIVCKNGWQKKELEKQGYKPILIKHAADFDNLKFTTHLTDEKVVGYVGQIKKVKGVRELAQACKELGYRLNIIGLPSEAEYFKELMDKYKYIITLGQGIPDDQMHTIYGNMRVYCANSDDGTESGTIPILEAMVSGIPVVTRNIGLVRDCGEHGKNMYIRKGHYTDIDDLKSALKMVMENEDIANELRENAWRAVRQYHPEIQAREYNKLFHKVTHPDKPLVSVIMPTYNRAEILDENLASLANQTHTNFEVVVCDDGTLDKPVFDFHKFPFPVKLIETGNYPEGDAGEYTMKKYGLAQARNMGIIESIGDILIFCDDRLKMHPNAISAFVKKLQSYDTKKVWLWGSKGTFKSFVENFSAAWRRQIIDGGMFSERITQYGGMGQEVSGRFAAQGFIFEWCPEALAEPIIATHSKSKHREDIIASKIKLYKMGFQ